MPRGKKSPIRQNIFYVHRKPGRFSPLSFMLFSKAGPTYPTPTAQQKKVAEAGRACGAQIRGKYVGSGQVAARRKAMGECIRGKFGRGEVTEVSEVSEVSEVE